MPGLLVDYQEALAITTEASSNTACVALHRPRPQSKTMCMVDGNLFMCNLKTAPHPEYSNIMQY